MLDLSFNFCNTWPLGAALAPGENLTYGRERKHCVHSHFIWSVICLWHYDYDHVLHCSLDGVTCVVNIVSFEVIASFSKDNIASVIVI